MLAGGRSRRFGADKLSAVYRGIPLLHHVVLRLVDACDDVVVVVPPGVQRPDLPGAAKVRVVHDDREGEGPLAGLLAGLRATTSTLSIVLGGDMPELSMSVVASMLGRAAETGAEAVVLAEGAQFRPLPCVLRVAPAWEAAETLVAAGERRLRALVASLRVEVIDEPTWTGLDPERRSLFDVDEPTDLNGP